MEQTLSKKEDRMVLIERVIDAPRELVFNAWSDAQHLKHWYAPTGCVLSYCSIDFRQGGILHHCIHNPQYGDCWCKGVFLEIVAPERIVYSMAFADKDGNFVGPETYLKDPEWPRETIVKVSFAEHQGKTLLTLEQSVSEVVAKRTGAHPSWLEMFDRLEKLVQL
jgi:uncharacterized protein YndB with AHSA1/START domain